MHLQMTAAAVRELSEIIFENAESLTSGDYKRSLDLLKVVHDAKTEVHARACAAEGARREEYLHCVIIELKEEARFWRTEECGMLHDVIAERDSRIEERDSRIEERDRTIAMLRSRLADESSPMLFGFSASDIRRALTVLNADAPPVVAD